MARLNLNSWVRVLSYSFNSAGQAKPLRAARGREQAVRGLEAGPGALLIGTGVVVPVQNWARQAACQPASAEVQDRVIADQARAVVQTAWRAGPAEYSTGSEERGRTAASAQAAPVY